MITHLVTFLAMPMVLTAFSNAALSQTGSYWMQAGAANAFGAAADCTTKGKLPTNLLSGGVDFDCGVKPLYAQGDGSINVQDRGGTASAQPSQPISEATSATPPTHRRARTAAGTSTRGRMATTLRTQGTGSMADQLNRQELARIQGGSAI